MAVDHDRRGVMRCVTVVVFACLAVRCTASPGSPRQITNSKVGAFEAALTITPDGPVAAWYDRRDGNGEIYLRNLDSDGNPDGPERRLTNDPHDSYEASIDAVGDAIAIAWYDTAKDGTLTARLGLWNRDGSNRWVTTLAPQSRSPVVCTNDRHIFVSWIQKTDEGPETVWLGTWNVQGEMIGSPRPLGAAHATTWNLNATLDEQGGAWVVFDAVASTRASELFLARVDDRAVSLARLTDDDGRESKYPDIAVRDGRVALTWFDAKDGNTEVYLVTGAAADFTGPLDGRARRVTQTSGESIGAYVEWNGDRVGLAWSDNTEGQHEVYFQPFDAAGRPLGSTTRVTANSMSSLVPAIEPWLDGFALAWNEFVPSSGGHDGRSEIAFAIVR